MTNIVIPAMGKSTFYKDSYFPKHLYEICGKTMLEFVVEDYREIEDSKYLFVFDEGGCLRFHVDASAHMLAPDSAIIRLANNTRGALCTSLMAVEYIDNDNPLIIGNRDQIIDIDYVEVISYFRRNHFDAGVITFPSVHPRWSYARIAGTEVVEVAEKRPISKEAIAGFYYFAQGRDFVLAAKKALMKQNSYEDNYYLSASINELILMNKRVGFYHIDAGQYHSFYSPAKVKEYEEKRK